MARARSCHLLCLCVALSADAQEASQVFSFVLCLCQALSCVRSAGVCAWVHIHCQKAVCH